MNLFETWNEALSVMRSYGDVSAVQMDAFFSRVHPQALSEGFLIAAAETSFIKDQVEKRYSEVMKRALNDMTGIDWIIEIEVDESCSSKTETSPRAPQEAQSFAAKLPASQQHDEGLKQDTEESEFPAKKTSMPDSFIEDQRIQEKEDNQSSFDRIEPSEQPKNNISSLLTFENYVIGDSNRLAYSMAVSVAESPGVNPMLNPLFIYGNSGLGKTHLLRAIQNYINDSYATMDVVYTDSSEFLNDYTSAVSSHDKDKKSLQAFQEKYWNADVLIIDDVQFFQGKAATIDMVFQLLNKLIDKGKQVVLSADRAPKAIDVDERMQSRFNQGGTFDIQPPEIETKLGIIKSFIEEYQGIEGGIDLGISEDVRLYIAEISGSNVRELKSAVTKILYQVRYRNKTNIDVEEVKDLLVDHFSSGSMKQIDISVIQKAIEQYYKVSHSELVGVKRTQNIAHARHIAIYLCRNMLDMPFGSIGKKFGQRDHSTIMHSVKTVEDKMRKNKEVRDEVEIITKMIKES